MQQMKGHVVMRKWVLPVNIAIVIFFSGLLAYTFAGRDDLSRRAYAHVLERTVEYAAPTMTSIEDALGAPLVERLVPERMLSPLRDTVSAYKSDPASYIATLIGQADSVVTRSDNPILIKVSAALAHIRAYYNQTLDALITDLCIFAITNLIVAVVATVLTAKSAAHISPRLVLVSVSMCIAVVYESLVYVDSATFFRIMTQTHLGWSYPVMLCTIIVVLLKVGSNREIVTQAP
jgi:hypothetical protein